MFVAEGPKIVEELLQAPNISVEQLFATEQWMKQNQQWQGHLQSRILQIDEEELQRISLLQSPNQVLGLFLKPIFSAFDPRNKISLMLDTIQDPGNLGTIIRCADWFGIDQIVCSMECADVFNPKVVQSTMGSISRVRVIYEDLLSFLQMHQSIPVYAAVLQGKNVNEHPPIKEGILLIGNESKGIREELLLRVMHHITIPRKGNAESLNAAVATGIILSHLV